MLGWFCGIVGKATSCNASIPCGVMFELGLLHFQPNFLLIASENSRRSQVFGPETHIGNQAQSFWLLASAGSAPTVAAMWGVNRWMWGRSLTISPSLSVILAFK